jgi:Phosphotransferase enzyme family
MRDMNEIPFIGGNMSSSIRVGDTVRRRAGAWTPAVQALLAHLASVGFDAVPEPLGTDEQGREKLTYVVGDVHVGWPDPLPVWMYRDEATLVAAAQLLRRYHDAVESFVPPVGARWRTYAPTPPEVICHNDWAPYNAVFAGHIPTAMLDWDSSGPGSRIWDIASSAYTWVPLKPGLNDPSIHEKATRLAQFCEAYRPGTRRDEVLTTLLDQLPFSADFIQAQADAGDPGYSKLAAWNVPARLRRDADLLRGQISDLAR